jgi:large subunit ribosomal protein L15
MQLHEIGKPQGATHKAKRKGRGEGSNWGKTAGRGQKGAGARKSANKGRMWLEGGNFPLWRATPKRGFSSPFEKNTQVVNLKALQELSETEIDIVVLVNNGLVRNPQHPVKILGEGELNRAITVKANAFSKKAQEAIEKAGGKVELI